MDWVFEKTLDMRTIQTSRGIRNQSSLFENDGRYDDKKMKF